MTKFCYQAVEEQIIYIDLPDSEGLKIKGILRGKLANPLVVMMHGLPGTGNRLLQYLGARYLYEHGFNSLRLFMYDFDVRTRNLIDCTLQNYADDFDEVISYLRKKGVKRLFATGHSYGGLTILKSQANLDGAVLWDPSHGSFWSEHRDDKYNLEYPTITAGDIVIGIGGYGYIVPKRLDKENHTMGDTSEWSARKGYPLKLIAAGKGAVSDLGQKYIDAANPPKEYKEITNAAHSFDDSDEIMLQLFDETVSWFERFN